MNIKELCLLINIFGYILVFETAFSLIPGWFVISFFITPVIIGLFINFTEHKLTVLLFDFILDIPFFIKSTVLFMSNQNIIIELACFFGGDLDPKYVFWNKLVYHPYFILLLCSFYMFEKHFITPLRWSKTFNSKGIIKDINKRLGVI